MHMPRQNSHAPSQTLLLPWNFSIWGQRLCGSADIVSVWWCGETWWSGLIRSSYRIGQLQVKIWSQTFMRISPQCHAVSSQGDNIFCGVKSNAPVIIDLCDDLVSDRTTCSLSAYFKDCCSRPSAVSSTRPCSKSSRPVIYALRVFNRRYSYS